MRSAPSAWIALLAVGTAFGAACYDFSSVSGGPRDGGHPESDASSPGGDASSPGGGFCASQPPPAQSSTVVFCDDFDESDAGAFTTWDQPVQINGSVGLTTIHPWSSPNAMSAQTSIAQVGEYPEADEIKSFSKFQNKNVLIKASFEMNVQQWDSNATGATGRIIAFEVIFQTGTAGEFNQIVVNLLSLGTGGVSALVSENATGADGGVVGYYEYPFQSHPKTSDWTKVEVTLSLPDVNGTSGNTVSVAVDGVTQIDGQPLQAPLRGGTPYVHLGIGYVHTPSTAWVVQYDDFVVTLSQF